MQVEIARGVLPVSRRLDWKTSRLSYCPRSWYDATDTWRARLERRLRAFARRRGVTLRLY